MPKNQPHIIIAHLLFHALYQLLSNEWSVHFAASIYLEESVPEPDLTILAGDLNRYLSQKPTPQDVGLVIEVSDSTLAYDRQVKRPLYAAAGLPVFWIVNLVDQQIEVYQNPIGGERPSFKSMEIYRPGDLLPVVLNREVLGEIAVAEILIQADEA